MDESLEEEEKVENPFLKNSHPNQQKDQPLDLDDISVSSPIATS